MNCNTIENRRPVRRYNNYTIPTFSTLINEFFNEQDTKSIFSNPKTRLQANILKKEDAFRIELFVPGYAKEDIDVKIDDTKLTVTAKHETTDENTETYMLKEYSLNEASRSFSLPKEVDVQKISAKHENGVLTINLPLAEEAQPKQIDIRVE